MIYIKLFLQYASQYIKTKLEYRGDFIVGLLSDLSLQAVNLIFILVVFGHTQALKGWSREEVIFIYGFSAVCHFSALTYGTLMIVTLLKEKWIAY